MKWRCSLFVLSVSAISCVIGCAHGQGNTTASAPKPGAQAQKATALPPPQVPPPAILQAPPPSSTPQVALDKYISFDKQEKEVTVPNGTSEAHFSFNLTNISSGEVMINGVQTSCGCTVAKLPSQPWKIAPNEGGEISATMQLAGVPPGGDKTKTLTVNSDKGSKLLIVKARVMAESAPAMGAMDRTNNVKAALADRQAVFRGDCATCHVKPARDAAGHDKMGQELYTAVCGICHNSEHQASFVPNLHKLPEPTNAEFWRNWIQHGKPGTLMPAFAKTEGGILSDEQVNSLAQYLTATIPSHPVITAPAAH
jgi:mono/diheme cytochrome c family protein